ncbi:hypothetical protein IFM89_032760 [Coptis chinensis]|uniref:Pentatricopeptide repeat-containing protein n=1 Tax=Coptis chinensis TaxID=261450 RepID=A0A835HFQ0_9MAGN|nr:hypothetical protein IFM89_032760 [Coptis chinensis]
MFTSISRLSRVFAKNTRITITATPQILTKTQTPKQEEETPTSINKLSKQKNLTTLVENFKKCSEIRSRHLVYEKTIDRLALAKHQKKFDDITKQGFAMRFISLYGKAGMFDHALKLFDELPERTVKTYNALLNANASVVSNKFDETDKLSDFPSAKGVYDNMLKSGIVPDWFTFEALIPCVCGKGEFGLALKLCEKSIGSNCHVSAGIVEVVVDGLVKGSKVEEAKGFMEIAQSKKCYRSKLKMPQEIE